MSFCLPCRFWNFRFLLLLLLACLVVGCGGDPLVMGGSPSGTDAGNAFTALILRPDGTPARGARAVARRAESLGDSAWPSVLADSVGRIELQLDTAQAWNIEVTEAGLASLLRAPRGGRRPEIAVALHGTGRLVGTLVGAQAGDRIQVLGLGRSAQLDARGGFVLDSLPADSLVVCHATSGQLWNASIQSGVTVNVVWLLGSAAGAAPEVILHLPAATPSGLVPLELESPVRQNPQALWSDFRLVASNGEVVAMQVEGRDSVSGRTRLWIRTPATTDTVITLRVLAADPKNPVVSPFRNSDLRLATLMAPVGGNLASPVELANLASGGGRVAGIHALAHLSPDPILGGTSLSASFGPDLITLDSTKFPGAWQGAVALRMRLLDARIGRLWLIHSADSTESRFVRVAWGADSLVLEVPGEHQAIFLACDGASHALGLVRETYGWSVYFDGQRLLGARGEAIGTPGSWGQMTSVVGRGGGLALKNLFVLDGDVSASGAALLAGRIVVSRVWPGL